MPLDRPRVSGATQGIADGALTDPQSVSCISLVQVITSQSYPAHRYSIGLSWQSTIL
jgi:hypothetical protein